MESCQNLPSKFACVSVHSKGYWNSERYASKIAVMPEECRNRQIGEDHCDVCLVFVQPEPVSDRQDGWLMRLRCWMLSTAPLPH
jgi:hypothetical protein